MTGYFMSLFTTEVQIFRQAGKSLSMCVPSPAELRIHAVATAISYVDTFVTLLIHLLCYSLQYFKQQI